MKQEMAANANMRLTTSTSCMRKPFLLFIIIIIIINEFRLTWRKVQKTTRSRYS